MLINYNFSALNPLYFPLGCLAEFFIEVNVTAVTAELLLSRFPPVGDGLFLENRCVFVGDVSRSRSTEDDLCIVVVTAPLAAPPFVLNTGIFEGLNFSVGIELFRTGTGISEFELFRSNVDRIWSTWAE